MTFHYLPTNYVMSLNEMGFAFEVDRHTVLQENTTFGLAIPLTSSP